MSIVQCPVQGCGKVFTDRGDLVTHRNSHDVATLFKQPAQKKPRKRSKPSKATSGPDMRQLRTDTARRAMGRCEAGLLCHPDCPRHVDNAPESEFAAHHVQPRRCNGPDELGNLIWVHNGTGLGAGGCHGRIHAHQRLARVIGLLSEAKDPFHGIGIPAGIALGFITEQTLKDAGLSMKETAA